MTNEAELRKQIETIIWFFEDDYAEGESKWKNKQVKETVDKLFDLFHHTQPTEQASRENNFKKVQKLVKDMRKQAFIAGENETIDQIIKVIKEEAGLHGTE